MSSIIPSGSIPPPPAAFPWWSQSIVGDDKIPPGTLAIVKPYIKGIFKHEWAGEVVVVMEVVHQSIATVPFYRVMCHRGSMIVSVNDLTIID